MVSVAKEFFQTMINEIPFNLIVYVSSNTNENVVNDELNRMVRSKITLYNTFDLAMCEELYDNYNIDKGKRDIIFSEDEFKFEKVV